MTTIRQELSALTKCELPALETSSLERIGIVDPDAPTEIAERTRKLQALLNQLSVGLPNGKALSIQQVTETNTRNMIRAGHAVGTNTLKPGNSAAWSGFLARDMGIVSEFLGIGDKLTDAGWVRSSLQRVQRLWRGGAVQAFRRYGFQKQMDNLYQDTVRLLRSKGLRRDQIDFITTEALEKGYYPHLRNTQYLDLRGQQILDKKYKHFLSQLSREFHLSQTEIDTVMRSGASAAALNSQIASIVRDMGIELGETKYWGYMHRATSTQAKMRFNWRYQDDNLNRIEWNDGSTSNPAEVFLRSRRTNQFVVEDEVLLDLVVRSLGQQHGDPLYFYRKAGGEAISDVLDTDYGLSNMLSSILEEAHPHVVEALLDSHLLSKIPYSTTEVFDYIRNSLKMPFRQLDEVFAMDWGEGMRLYRKSLEEEASRSGFINLMVNKVHDEGWGVPLTTAALNPELYAGWQPLRKVLSPDIVRTNYQKYNPMLDNYLLHPVAARQAVAMQEIMTSPYAMGLVARVINNIGRTWRSMVLATVEYVPRQVWQSFISVGAAGGDIMAFASNVIKWGGAVVLRRDGFVSTLDDATPKYKLRNGDTLTQRQLYNYLEEVGMAEQLFDPGTTLPITKKYKGRSGVDWVARHARYLAHTFGNENIGRTAEEFFGDLADLSDPIMNTIMTTNVVMNNIGVLSTVESLLTDNTRGVSHYLRSVRRLAGGQVKRFDTIEDAIEHVRHYFFQYDDATWFDRQMRSYGIPFYGFLSKNIPSVIRYMFRHPSRFLTHQRIYSLANYPASDEEWLNEGSVDGWSMEAAPIYWKVPGGRPDGSDAFFVLPMEPIDPIMSGVNFVGEPITGLLNHMGIFRDATVRTTQDRVNELPTMNTTSNRLFRELLDRSYPQWKAIINAANGDDLYGRPLDEENEWLGFRVSNATRTFWETLVPVLGTVNRYNPAGFRGTPDRYNPQSGEWELGDPGWLGNRMSGRDSFNTDNPYSSMRYMGIKVYPVDVYMNSGRTIDTLRIAILDGRKDIQRLREQAATQSNPQEAARMNARANAWQYLIDQTTEDLIRFERFMKSEGITNPNTAYQRLTRRNIRIGDLPSGQ